MKISISYSGGLDSRILLHYAKIKHPNDEVTSVFWDHGHKADAAEISRLPKSVQVRKVDWLNLPVVGNYLEKTTEKQSGAMYIPGRNLAFAVLTACQELPDEVWLGNLTEEAHENATDKNYEFMRRATSVLEYVLSPWKEKVEVKAPFISEGWTKFDSVEWALKNGLSQDELKNTYSCYNLNSESTQKCGNCKQCVRRFLIFGKLGFDELDELAQHPLKAEKSRQWIIDIIDALGAIKWQGSLVAEVPKYFDHLPVAVEKYAKDDSELQRVSSLIIKQYGSLS